MADHHDPVGEHAVEPAVNSLALRIADYGVRLVFPDDRLIPAARERYAGFLSELDPHTTLAISFPESLQSVVDAGVPWASCATNEIRFARNDLHGETDGSFRRVNVAMRCLLYTLDALLRIFYSIVLIRRGGMLLHAASVGLEGRGLAFAGPTESGKSALSHMQRGIHLTDELSPIVPSDEGFTVFGSPFWGLFERGGHNVGLPLGALFLLRRGTTRLEPLTRVQALQGIMRCVLNFSREPAVVDTIMTNVSRLLDAIPVARLVAPPDETVWPLVNQFARRVIPPDPDKRHVR